MCSIMPGAVSVQSPIEFTLHAAPAHVVAKVLPLWKNQEGSRVLECETPYVGSMGADDRTFIVDFIKTRLNAELGS